MMISPINKKYFLMAVSDAKLGKQTDMDIAVRCPICGDSAKNKNSKRLHIFHKNGKDGIKCFNGSCPLNDGVLNTYKFLKDFYPNLLDSYKRETFQTNLTNLHKQNDPIDVFAEIQKENQENIVKESPVTPHNLFDYFDDLSGHVEALTYLYNRGINYLSTNYEWYFGKQDLKIGDKLYKLTNSIIIPLYYNDEMYGFYSRNINNKEFYTYNPECNMGYKIWNWFQIDKQKKCYIFEGIFDAISSKHENIIGLMGAKIPKERLDELKYPVFVLDNDKTGILNSIEYAKQGYTVYVQPTFFKEKDMNELMLNHPELDIPKMIDENCFSGISAIVRLKAKL